MEYGYMWFHCLCKNGRNLQRQFKRCWKHFFYTSNYGLERLLPKGRSKKVISLMKDKLRKKVMKEFVGLRGKTYSYLTDDSSENIKAKGKLKHA